MKLDATDLRYVTSDEFRVLTAVSKTNVAELEDCLTGLQVEMGSKNHEIVPTVLIVKISGLRNGGVNKILGSLAKRNLVSRVQNARCAFLHYPANSVLRLRSLAALSYNRRRIPAHLWRVRLPRNARHVKTGHRAVRRKSDRRRQRIGCVYLYSRYRRTHVHTSA